MGTVVSIGVLPAVLRVTDDRVADGTEVCTDLVGLTGDEVDLQYSALRFSGSYAVWISTASGNGCGRISTRFVRSSFAR